MNARLRPGGGPAATPRRCRAAGRIAGRIAGRGVALRLGTAVTSLIVVPALVALAAGADRLPGALAMRPVAAATGGVVYGSVRDSAGAGIPGATVAVAGSSVTPTGFFGSMGGTPLNRPIVGMAGSPSGNGYWLVASDGGIFAFGDAAFHGSTGSIRLNKPIVAMAATPTGAGYWFVASDGGIFAFGDAGFFGSAGGTLGSRTIVAMAASPAGNGYWLVAADGGVLPEGAAGSYGSPSGLASPIATVAVTPGGTGYWLVAVDGGLFSYGSATRVVSASSAVDGLGQYSIGVPAGQYVVVVQATVDGRSLRAQTGVTISDGATVEVSARLNASRTGFDFGPFPPAPQPGSISGAVTDAGTHAPLGGICASLYSTQGVRTTDPQACTNAQGTYTMAVASAGSYDLAFSGAGYATQWYSGQATQGAATRVVVHAGAATPNVNAAMVSSAPPAPAVGGVSPASGPMAGGQTVTITGSHLSGATAVSFGGVAGTVVSSGPAQVVVISPARAAGLVDITVTTGGGTSTVGAQDGYTYVAPPATITAVGSVIVDTQQPSELVDTVAVSPAAAGNLLTVAIETKFPGTPSFSVSSVTGGGVTVWHKALAFMTLDGFHGQELWWGVVTAAGPSTITVNYTSAAAVGTATSVDVQQFHSSSGASTVWSLDATGKLDTGVASSTLSYPTLDPGSDAELYFGYLAVPGTLSAGSTPGVTYTTDARGNQVAYSTTVSSSLTPTALSHDMPPTSTYASIGLLISAV